jgi:hypothetical protein
MASPPLSDQELEYVREFFTSTTARNLFTKIQEGLVMDWINTMDTASREAIWTDLQALLRLVVALRDAQGLKRMDVRSASYQL